MIAFWLGGLMGGALLGTLLSWPLRRFAYIPPLAIAVISAVLVSLCAGFGLGEGGFEDRLLSALSGAGAYQGPSAAFVAFLLAARRVERTASVAELAALVLVTAV
ncbi:MAG: hypothetical protein AAFV51_05455 [Pseudomonadota bacterium]